MKKIAQFDSWRSFWNFERTVRMKNRYFRNKENEKFLQTILETVDKRKMEISKDKGLWRAQLGNDWRPDYQNEEYMGDIPIPYPPERMSPLLNEATEGRANPKGIPYLYTATTKGTSMAEVKPWLGSLISVGLFRTKMDMVLVNCSVDHDGTRISLYFEEPEPEKREKAVWAHIDRAFSKPLTSNDQMADYVPTQIISELFKCNGFDGIVYKSMLGEGHNVVLFDIEAANLVDCSLFKLDNISFSFNEGF